MGTLGEVVGVARVAEGMSHKDRAARVGATQATLPRVERGVRRDDGGCAAQPAASRGKCPRSGLLLGCQPRATPGEVPPGPRPTGRQGRRMTDIIEQTVVPSADAGARRTSLEGSESGFVASDAFITALQRVLVDLTELHLQGKQAHWNVVGKNFRDLHLQLDEIVEEAREQADVIAERLRALHAVPDGRSATVAATTSLPPYPNGEVQTDRTIDLITERLDHTVATVREVHDLVDSEDPTTADLLHEIISDFEKLSWMVSAENRVAAQ